ncbi:MAG: hypothetical protein INR62_00655 [Rhodospirillales bacterium]|nr:hypothetical protein [Acetobacter sp.]
MPILNIQQEPANTLVFNFPEQFTTKNLKLMLPVVAKKLDPLPGGVRKVVFNLAKVDPVFNNAGRIMDAAVDLRERLYEDVRIEMNLPGYIYEDLRRTDQELPDPQGPTVEYRGIGIRLLSRAEDAPPTITVLQTYAGKVREIHGDEVTVSLWTEGGEEVIGEFSRGQFAEGAVEVGTVFEYQSVVTAGVKTETFLRVKPKVALSSDEFLGMWERAQEEIPDDV